jgi:NitT/TauT family transport system substrate-binding protein
VLDVVDDGAKDLLSFSDALFVHDDVKANAVDILDVDNAKVPDFRREGGEQLVKSMALKAMELSRQRAQSVRTALLERHQQLDGSRLETVGRGWEEPAGSDSDLNRRVEVQWFTLE